MIKEWWQDVQRQNGPGGFSANPMFMAGLRGLSASGTGGDWGAAMSQGMQSANALQGSLADRARAEEQMAFQREQFELQKDQAARQGEMQEMQLKKMQMGLDSQEATNLWLGSPDVQGVLASLGAEGAPPAMAAQIMNAHFKEQMDKGNWAHATNGILYNTKTGRTLAPPGGSGAGGLPGALPLKQRYAYMKANFQDYTKESVDEFMATGALNVLKRAENPSTWKDAKSFKESRAVKARKYDEIWESYMRVAQATSPTQRKSAPAQLAALVAFTKFLDPGSVAREGEVALAQSAASLMERVQRTADNVKTGAVLSQTQIDQMVDVMKHVMSGYKSAYGKWREQGTYSADLYGFDKRTVLGDDLDWTLGGKYALPGFGATSADAVPAVPPAPTPAAPPDPAGAYRRRINGMSPGAAGALRGAL